MNFRSRTLMRPQLYQDISKKYPHFENKMSKQKITRREINLFNPEKVEAFKKFYGKSPGKNIDVHRDINQLGYSPYNSSKNFQDSRPHFKPRKQNTLLNTHLKTSSILNAQIPRTILNKNSFNLLSSYKSTESNSFWVEKKQVLSNINSPSVNYNIISHLDPIPLAETKYTFKRQKGLSEFCDLITPTKANKNIGYESFQGKSPKAFHLPKGMFSLEIDNSHLNKFPLAHMKKLPDIKIALFK